MYQYFYVFLFLLFSLKKKVGYSIPNTRKYIIRSNLFQYGHHIFFKILQQSQSTGLIPFVYLFCDIEDLIIFIYDQRIVPHFHVALDQVIQDYKQRLIESSNSAQTYMQGFHENFLGFIVEFFGKHNSSDILQDQADLVTIVSVDLFGLFQRLVIILQGFIIFLESLIDRALQSQGQAQFGGLFGCNAFVQNQGSFQGNLGLLNLVHLIIAASQLRENISHELFFISFDFSELMIQSQQIGCPLFVLLVLHEQSCSLVYRIHFLNLLAINQSLRCCSFHIPCRNMTKMLIIALQLFLRVGKNKKTQDQQHFNALYLLRHINKIQSDHQDNLFLYLIKQMNIFGKKQILHHFKILFPLPLDKIQNCLKKIQFLNMKTTSALCISFNGHTESPETAQIFYDSLLSVRQVNKVQTYAFLQNYATSLSYLSASSAAHIIANPYSLIGDVGTTQKSYRNIRRLLELIGIKYASYGSKNESTELWNQFVERTQKEKEITTKWLEMVSSNLIKTVSEARNIPKESIESIKNKVFHPKEALRLKLIDKISTFEQFVDINYPNHQIQSYVYKLDGTRLRNLSQRQITALNTLIEVIQMPNVALFSSQDLLQQSLRQILTLIEQRLLNDANLEELQAIAEYMMVQLQSKMPKAELIF